ncbi:recombinase family protein [Humitalea sp. 24SJ18S-53]|uniref:recombinase family protein n=1 Tax=Humitalea sp. 24SJ18S-53 TaxID=3422307 RepID=UPI003D66E81B
MPPKAYSYLRFSTPEQAKGDSLRRQTALAEQYAEKHGLDLDQELTFQDLGLSALRGANAETGRLGDFRRAVEDGYVLPGATLLVESLDRISRQAARKALGVLGDIVDKGVTVVTLNDERAYTKRTLDDDPMSLLLALLTFIRGNEESETKARRLRAAWVGKRQKAAEKPLTSICPAWLELDRATERFAVREERAEVVRRIFRLAAEGVGLHGIAQQLNDDGVPTFGHPGRRADFWQRSYVAKIVANPTVTGTLLPHVMEHAEGTRKRRALDAVPNYYPAVITEEAFQAIQARRLGAHTARNRTGATLVSSLVAGLAECPACGSTMTRVAKGSGARAGKPRLVCVRARAKLCDGKSVILEHVERALEDRAEEIVGTAPVGGEELQAEIDQLDAAAGAVGDLRAEAEVDWRASRSTAARDRMTRLEAELDRAQAKLKAAQERRAAAGPGLQARLSVFRAAIAARPLERPKVNALLRSFLKAVVVNPTDGTLGLHWTSGGVTTVDYAWGGAESRRRT